MKTVFDLMTTRWLVCMAGFLTVQNLLAGMVNLSWTAPTTNTDGSPLTDLAGYRVYSGCGASGLYDRPVETIGAGVESLVIGSLPDAGVCYFVATTVNSQGVESSFSNEASKVMSVSTLVVYGIIQSRDRIVLLPVGEISSDVFCDTSQSVNGRYVVPRDEVTFAGSVRPEVVFAECSP